MKQIISVIMVCVFAWTNTAWAKHPNPKNRPENQTAQTASDDIFILATEPVLTWTKDNVLVICKADCGNPKPDQVYALYQGKGFPAKTDIQILPVQENPDAYIIQYQLDGTACMRTITNKMLVKHPPIAGPTSGGHTNRPASGPTSGHPAPPPGISGIPATAPDGRPILQMQYKYIEETGTIYLESENSYGYVWGVIKGKNGELIGHNIYVVDKTTGTTMLSTTNVDIKITHWAELAKTLGIVAGITTTVGLLAFWAPGIIIAATPVFP